MNRTAKKLIALLICTSALSSSIIGCGKNSSNENASENSKNLLLKSDRDNTKINKSIENTNEATKKTSLENNDFNVVDNNENNKAEKNVNTTYVTSKKTNALKSKKSNNNINENSYLYETSFTEGNSKCSEEHKIYNELTSDQQKELEKIPGYCETLLRIEEIVNEKIKAGIASDEDKNQLVETKELLNQMNLNTDLVSQIKYGSNIKQYIKNHTDYLNKLIKENKIYNELTVDEQKELQRIPNYCETLVQFQNLINNRIKIGIASDEDKNQLVETKELLNQMNLNTDLVSQIKYGSNIKQYIKNHTDYLNKLIKENKIYNELTVDEQKELQRIPNYCETLVQFQNLINNRIKIGIASDEEKNQLGKIKDLLNEMKLNTDLVSQIKYGSNIKHYIKENNIDLNKLTKENKIYNELTVDEQKELQRIPDYCETLVQFQNLINNRIKIGIASDEEKNQLGKIKDLLNEMKLNTDLVSQIKYGSNIKHYIKKNNIDLKNLIKENNALVK